MQLSGLDWVVIAACVLIIFLPALFFARRGSSSVSQFFASGRSAPWWLIGTSMVATTFAADTPGLVTQFVRENGVSGNWMWWAFLLTGMATVFFYARLWRRLGTLTDLEFYEIRYSGRSAALVRGFRAVYLGLVFNCFIMAAVTLAAVKIAAVLLGAERWQTITFSIVLCTIVAGVSGLWGVLVSDLVQFAIAICGSFAAAYYAVVHPKVGGLEALVHSLPASTLSILPDFHDWRLVLTVLIIPLTVQWWSVWYPGAEPGGGSYIAQRILAARNERHAVGATLWFNLAHYALRPWPWILVALASMIVFPHLSDLSAAFPDMDAALANHDMAYPAMLTLLPHGVLGLVVASLLAAYVSTMSTHLNWGSSYLVNDLYLRFVNPKASQKKCVALSRLVTTALMLLSGGLVYFLDSARHAFDLMLSIGAGTGLLYLLRWFWWRINAWSEIVAMAGSFGVSTCLLLANRSLAGGSDWGGAAGYLVSIGVLERTGDIVQIPTYMSFLTTVLLSTILWISATLLTRPVRRETLISFCRLAQPAGPGWRTVRSWASIDPSPDSISRSLLSWVLGCSAVYSGLFGTGCLILGSPIHGAVLLACFAVCAVWLIRMMVPSRASPA